MSISLGAKYFAAAACATSSSGTNRSGRIAACGDTFSGSACSSSYLMNLIGLGEPLLVDDNVPFAVVDLLHIRQAAVGTQRIDSWLVRRLPVAAREPESGSVPYRNLNMICGRENSMLDLALRVTAAQTKLKFDFSFCFKSLRTASSVKSPDLGLSGSSPLVSD